MKWRTYKEDIDFIYKFKIDKGFNYSGREIEEKEEY